jgi:hypothetical protein
MHEGVEIKAGTKILQSYVFIVAKYRRAFMDVSRGAPFVCLD